MSVVHKPEHYVTVVTYIFCIQSMYVFQVRLLFLLVWKQHIKVGEEEPDCLQFLLH